MSDRRPFEGLSFQENVNVLKQAFEGLVRDGLICAASLPLDQLVAMGKAEIARLR